VFTVRFALPPLLLDPSSSEGQQARKTIRRCAQALGRSLFEPSGVVFGIDTAFTASSSNRENATALRALMDCLVDLDVLCLRAFPDTPPLYESGVFYRLMPYRYPWDTVPTLYARGYGDCKSLAAARIAELRLQGMDATPVFRHLSNSKGTMFHILLWRGDGQWECPSRALGMRALQEAAQ